MKKLVLTLFAISSSYISAMKALPDNPMIPKNNPQSVQKIELGKMLFFDPRLSIDGTISCNSCHNVMLGGEDRRSVSVGVKGQKGDRSAPTVWNAAFHSTQFWDGRAKSLEEQAVGPITNPIEMGMPNFKAVVARLKLIPGYVQAFKKVFPGKKSISKDHIGKAIASFERTLITHNAPFDLYKKGNKKAMSKDALAGMKLVEEVGCTTCHIGVNFAGEGLAMGEANLQLFPTYEKNAYVKKYKLKKDLGAFESSKNKDDKHMWRVPTWRNVAETAPYFHNGSVATLAEAVRVMGKTQLDLDLKLDQVRKIVAFLESLSGEFPKISMPRLYESRGKSVISLDVN